MTQPMQLQVLFFLLLSFYRSMSMKAGVFARCFFLLQSQQSAATVANDCRQQPVVDDTITSCTHARRSVTLSK